MKYIPGTMTGTMSGSAGAMTASHNRSGAYFRTKAGVTNPNTTRQQAVRSAFTTLVVAWGGTLSAAQRTGWETYAANVPVLDKLGQTINLTGQNMYVRNNVPRLQAGNARVDTAPGVFNNGENVTSFQSSNDAVAGDIALDNGGTALSITAMLSSDASADGDLYVYLGPPRGSAIIFDKGPFQLLTVIAVASTDDEVSLDTAVSGLLNDNGALAAGQRRCLRLRIAYDDGRLSSPFMGLGPVVNDSV